MITEQWFADAKFLSRKAIQLVKKKKQIFFQIIGPKHIFSGWIIFNHGVYRDNYGGDTEYPHGIQKIKKFLWQKMKMRQIK